MQSKEKEITKKDGGRRTRREDKTDMKWQVKLIVLSILAILFILNLAGCLESTKPTNLFKLYWQKRTQFS